MPDEVRRNVLRQGLRTGIDDDLAVDRPADHRRRDGDRDPVVRHGADRPLLPVADEVRAGAHLVDRRNRRSQLRGRGAGADDTRVDPGDAKSVGACRQRRDLVGARLFGRAGPVGVAAVREHPDDLEPEVARRGADLRGPVRGRAGPAVAGVELEHDLEALSRAGDGRRKALGAGTESNPTASRSPSRS